MLLTIEDYMKQFPSDSDYPMRLSKTYATTKSGMLKWDNEYAFELHGPFDGGFAFIRIVDEIEHCKFSPRKVMSEKDTIEYMTPHCRRMLRKRAPSSLSLTKKEREDVISKQAILWTRELPTLEKPISFYICGTDDSSWTMYFESEAKACEMLALLDMFPPTMNDILTLGFFFSN